MVSCEKHDYLDVACFDRDTSLNSDQDVAPQKLLCATPPGFYVYISC